MALIELGCRRATGVKRYTVVDEADFEWLSKYKWSLIGKGYVRRAENGKTILMHREIMRPPRGMAVDHINRNPLDNRRENLRVVTCRENNHNRATYKARAERKRAEDLNLQAKFSIAMQLLRQAEPFVRLALSECDLMPGARSDCKCLYNKMLRVLYPWRHHGKAAR